MDRAQRRKGQRPRTTSVRTNIKTSDGRTRCYHLGDESGKGSREITKKTLSWRTEAIDGPPRKKPGPNDPRGGGFHAYEGRDGILKKEQDRSPRLEEGAEAAGGEGSAGPST